MATKPTATERQLMDAIADTAVQLGYQCAHIPDALYALAATEGRFDAMGGAKGLPDLLICGYGVFMALEVKDKNGTVDRAQQEWMDAFTAFVDAIAPESRYRMHVQVVRPEDQDYIQETLVFHREESWKEAS